MKNPLKSDPTRTTTLRLKFMQAVARRLRELKGEINKLVIEDDAFGLKKENKKLSSNVPIENAENWRFKSHPDQITAFQNWLKLKLQVGLIGAASKEEIENAYWKQYVEEGYKKGAGRSYEDVKGKLKSTGLLTDTKEQFLRDSFSQPVSIDKVKLLAGRVYSDLQGVSETMSAQMSRVLTDGLVRGDSPRDVARDLNNRVEKIGRTRSLTIARTETIRAHAEGQLDALEQLGVEKIKVMVEWSTAGDDKVCPLCVPLNGVVLKIKEARGMIPRHPNCRCAFIPANLGESNVGQKKSKAQVDEAIRESLKAGASKKDVKSLSLEELKSKSNWSGATNPIGKGRPKPIITPSDKLNKKKQTDKQKPNN